MNLTLTGKNINKLLYDIPDRYTETVTIYFNNGRIKDVYVKGDIFEIMTDIIKSLREVR